MQVYREVNQIPVSDLVLASTSLELNEPISQGDLITETRFRQSALVTEDVVTTIIQQLRSMPDHKTITTSLYPKLVRTPAAYICVYGWNMVEEALKAQQITIRCSVRYLRQISDADLAILKVIIRFRSKDSTSYAELAANVRRLVPRPYNTHFTASALLEPATRVVPFDARPFPSEQQRPFAHSTNRRRQLNCRVLRDTLILFWWRSLHESKY